MKKNKVTALMIALSMTVLPTLAGSNFSVTAATPVVNTQYQQYQQVPYTPTANQPLKGSVVVVPAGTSSELADFNLAAMRRIAAGHGLSYEMVSRDVSQVNYSSARQNLLEDWKVFKQQQEFLISHFLDFVFEGVVKSAILSGKLPDKIVPKDFWKQPSKYLKH